MSSRARVVVVGAGPAGAGAARQLARAGYAVTVLERSRTSRPKIGESLPPKVEGPLAALGLTERVARAGFARMRGTVVERGHERRDEPFDPEGGRLGFQVERARFDALLLEAAREVGAQVRTGVAARALVERGGRVRGVEVEAGGGIECIEADWVVDATGRAAWSSRAAGRRRREGARTVALAGYWAEARVPDDFEATATLFEMLPDGWIWSVLRQDGLRNVTVGVDAEGLERGAEGRERQYETCLRGSRLVGPLVTRARRAGPVTVHDATRQRVEPVASPGLLAVGDSASVIDPITSQGVYKALQSAVIAACVVNTACVRPEDEDMAVAYYAASQAQLADEYAALADHLYRASPFAEAPFWAARVQSTATARGARQADRRDAFREAVQRGGGQGTVLWAEPGLALELRAAAGGGFVQRRHLLVYEGAVVETPRIDPQALLPLLDGRPMAKVYDGYAAATAQAPSRALGRQLMGALVALAGRGALGFSPSD